MNEELLLTFDVRIKETTASLTPGEVVSTLLFYFRNQGAVAYYDSEYWGYSFNNNNTGRRAENIKRNASGPEPVQVFIDPIKLDKTLSSTNGDEPFDVTLTVRNVTEFNINTNGIITDVIPKGFEIVNDEILIVSTATDSTPQPAGFTITENPDGSNRITIRGVELNSPGQSIAYSYRLRYAGEGYGVAFTSVEAAAYRYTYENRNEPDVAPITTMLRFPQHVVGISVKTQEDNFTVPRTATSTSFDILQNDWLREQFADDNYNMDMEVVLLVLDNPNATETDWTFSDAERNPNGEYQISVPEQFVVRLLPSTNELVFELLPDFPADRESVVIYYQVRVKAEKPGSPSFALDSPPTKVTINISSDGGG
jgi:hypothetical protein